MSKILADARTQVVEYLRKQLVGPCDGTDEVLADTPNRRYLMGILFPRTFDLANYIAQEGENADGDTAAAPDEESIFGDDPVSASNDFLPASQGLSFFTNALSAVIQVDAAHYTTLEGDEALLELSQRSPLKPAEPTADGPRDTPRHAKLRAWRRTQLPTASLVVRGNDKVSSVFDGRAEVHVRWRTLGSGALVTATIVNAARGAGQVDRMWDDMLLQVELCVHVEAGEILEYPHHDFLADNPEDQELRLQYSAHRNYAIGHGCAAIWSPVSPVTWTKTEVLPQQEVLRVDAEGQQTPALQLSWLADESRSPQELHDELSGFVSSYADWISNQRNKVADLTGKPREAGNRIQTRLVDALTRLKAGVDILRDKHDVRRSFQLANEAMRRQMRHSQTDLAGSRHPRSEAPSLPVDYDNSYRWRPFQLAFALLALPGMVDPEHEDRELVDLIWFPTGGGKTEAYLLLAVFEIFYRRFSHGVSGGGTAVISRYTLTLLTNQQFQRTATTICAADRVRAENDEQLGSEPISIGLWVGQSMTPNSYTDALSAIESIRSAEQPDNDFVLERCPWCGTEIVPRFRSEQLVDYGLSGNNRSFHFNCPSPKCPYGERLPVHVVDDAIYESPPSFLLATVDKFAGLAWESKAGALFGEAYGNNAPSLIIQDELHLLTGPLGTTVGLYETAVERLCSRQGYRPKIISCTATIRRAADQVLGLFGRDVQLFPPAGVSAEDSYFARTTDNTPGRLYVGVMAQGHTADTATVHALSALLQAPVALDLDEQAKDAYWTLVAYHSSLRELGRTVTLARDDVTSRLNALSADAPPRKFDVEELTSNIDRNSQARLLERLGLPASDRSKVDLLASTNMFSVGVDVPRLALMVVNGQPKATAEYIQATSRVGRSQNPGLVVSLFRSTRPRDRSHYENFGSYHAALYRYVEPTSVTPFSPPSRERALHAALVILVRHRLGLADDASAGRILERLSEVAQLVDELENAVSVVEAREAGPARQELESFVANWVAKAREASNEGKALHYQPGGKGQHSLLKDFNRRGDAWPTPRSMRNVDRESLIDISKAGSRKGAL